MIIFRVKHFTRWDDTDSLKRMKDSDLLAEKKKKGTLGNTASKFGLGTLTGGTVGTGVGAVLGAKKGGLKGAIHGAKVGGASGAFIGGSILGTGAAISNSKEQEDINFYNNRLEYAQRQARRRERSDWRQNMTQREGYTY